MTSKTSNMCPPACPFSLFYYATILVFVFVSRGRQVMWPRAATVPGTGLGLHSSHMWMKTNSRALRHMHVRIFLVCLFFILINLRAFSTSISNTQTSLTCWTTMRRLLEYQRQSLRRSFRRTGSSLIQWWRQIWWRCSKTSREGETALSTKRRDTDPAQPLFTLLVKIRHASTFDIYSEMKNRQQTL